MTRVSILDVAIILLAIASFPVTLYVFLKRNSLPNTTTLPPPVASFTTPALPPPVPPSTRLIGMTVTGTPFSSRRRLFDIDWKTDGFSNLDWQTATVPADNYIATFESSSFCTSFTKSNGQLVCENELVVCQNITLDVTLANEQPYCNFSLPDDGNNYTFLLGHFNRNVRLNSSVYWSSHNETCYSDERSSLDGASANITQSNALGMFSPTADGDASSLATMSSVYFYSSIGENAQYLCRNSNCSEALSIPAFARDPLKNGTIGGNPTDIVDISDFGPTDTSVGVMIQFRTGALTQNTTSLNIRWDTTYGAIFERVRGACTVSSYAINIRVKVET